MAKKLKLEHSVRDHYPKRHGDSSPAVVPDSKDSTQRGKEECTRKGRRCQKHGKKSTCSRTGHLCEVA